MNTFSSNRLIALSTALVIAGWSGTALADLGDAGTSNMSQTVNRADKAGQLRVSPAPWEIARSGKGDLETVQPLTESDSGEGGESSADETSHDGGTTTGDLPRDQVVELLDDPSTAVVEPAAAAPKTSTNLSPDSEYTYSRGFIQRTERRVGYLWSLLSQRIGGR